MSETTHRGLLGMIIRRDNRHVRIEHLGRAPVRTILASFAVMAGLATLGVAGVEAVEWGILYHKSSVLDQQDYAWNTGVPYYTYQGSINVDGRTYHGPYSPALRARLGGELREEQTGDSQHGWELLGIAAVLEAGSVPIFRRAQVVGYRRIMASQFDQASGLPEAIQGRPDRKNDHGGKTVAAALDKFYRDRGEG